MVAILAGLGAAAVFAAATLCNSRSSRILGPQLLLAWIMLIGLALIAPFVALAGVPQDLDGADAPWLAIAGAGNVVGLLLVYAALRAGKVGVVAPIVSTQGAVAAVLALAAGEQLARGAGAALGAIAVGVVLAAVPREERSTAQEPDPARAALLAMAAALAIGASLYAVGRVSADLPVAWALLPSRLIGVLAITLPLALRAGLRMTRAALPLVAVAGACEVGGFALFALGSRHGIAVTAVLASQFALLAAVAAYALFGERLSRLQLAGAAIVVAGVGLLSGLQA